MPVGRGPVERRAELLAQRRALGARRAMECARRGNKINMSACASARLCLVLGKRKRGCDCEPNVDDKNADRNAYAKAKVKANANGNAKANAHSSDKRAFKH